MRKLFDAFLGALKRRDERALSAAGPVCAHSGRPAVHQRSRDDCMICALTMLTGRTYEEVVAAATALSASFPRRGPMSHSMMRSVAHQWGFALLSGIYMNWQRPAIIGVRSPNSPDTGHAVFWDGEKLIDPGSSLLVDRDYIDRNSIEFTQRASDLHAIIAFESAASAAVGTTSIDELV
jgi:hypothetical protein